VNWYQPVRIGKEAQILREQDTALRSTYTALFDRVSISLPFKLNGYNNIILTALYQLHRLFLTDSMGDQATKCGGLLYQFEAQI